MTIYLHNNEFKYNIFYMKKTIQLKESDIARLVMEAVNELDWKTYSNYQKGRMDQAKQTETLGDYDKANIYRNKAVIGGNAAGAAARKQYGFNDLDDFNEQQRAVRNNMTNMYTDGEKVKQRVQRYNNNETNYYNGSSKYIKGQGWVNEGNYIPVGSYYRGDSSPFFS